MNDVFNKLFDSEGASINVYPVEKYVKLNQNIPYSSIVYSASLNGESAIGIRFDSKNISSQSEGLHLNPSKKMRFTPEMGDDIIVISTRNGLEI